MQLTEKAVILVKIKVSAFASKTLHREKIFSVCWDLCAAKNMSTNLEQQVAAGGSLTYDFFWQHTNLNKHCILSAFSELFLESHMMVVKWCRNIWTLLAATWTAFHMKCQRQILDIRWLAHRSRLHAQRCPRDLSTIITEILAYLFVTLLAWILEYQHMMLCVWRWIPTNVECRWPAGEDRRTVGPPSQRLTQQCPEWRYMHCSVLSAISALTKWSNTSWADCSINSRAIVLRWWKQLRRKSTAQVK